MLKNDDRRRKPGQGGAEELPVELWTDEELESTLSAEPEVELSADAANEELEFPSLKTEPISLDEDDVSEEFSLAMVTPKQISKENQTESPAVTEESEPLFAETESSTDSLLEELIEEMEQAVEAEAAQNTVKETLSTEKKSKRKGSKRDKSQPEEDLQSEPLNEGSAEAFAATAAIEEDADMRIAGEEAENSSVPLTTQDPGSAGSGAEGATRVMDPLDFLMEQDDEEDAAEADEEDPHSGKRLLWVLLPVLGIMTVIFLLLQLLLNLGFTTIFGLDLSNWNLFNNDPLIYRELTMEIGAEELLPDAFINQQKNKEHLSALFSQTGGYDLNKIGDYKLRLRFDSKDYDVVLHVVDTVAPVAVMRTALIALGQTLAEEDLVETIYDKSNVQVYVSKFDASTSGVKNVTVRLVDEAGNSTEYETRVYVADRIASVIYEIGAQQPVVEDFVSGIEGLSFAESNFAAYGIAAPGEYEITLRCGEDIMKLPLTAKDTVAPVAVAKADVELVGSALPDAATLLESVQDATAVTVSYKENYRFEADGRYMLTLVVTDLGGNETEVTVPVFIYFSEEITDAPLIIASDITVEIGSAVPYQQYIRIIDSVDGAFDLYDKSHVTFDTSTVDTSTVGNYSLVIKAVDNEGNTSTKTITVHVVHKAITQESVNSYVKQILSRIISAGMTREQQLKAVFNYIKKESGMTYTGTSDKQNLYFVEAYYGFTINTGDCYTYCSMSRVMLDCLGIDYYVVERSGVRNSNHYWLLVDFGDGWYHFDTCYHAIEWTKETFKLTDGEVKAFTDWYNKRYSGWNYYQFDQSLYPPTPVLNADGKTYTYTPYTVTYSAGRGGSIVGEGFQKVGHGETGAPVTAAPAPGYVFKRWSDGVLTATRTDLIKSSLNVTAEFEVGSLPDKSYVLSYKAQSGGYISGNTTQNVYEGYYGSEVRAIANAGYVFTGWSDGVTTPNRTDLSKANLTVTAQFAPDTSSFTLIYTPGEGGTLSGSTTQVLKSGETGTVVKAIPKPGYVFKRWSDGVSTAERSDKASANLSVIAEFEKLESYQLIYEAQVGGSISGNTEQSVSSGETGSEVKAVAAIGYLFDGWSDGVTTAERKDAATEDLKVTAKFKRDPAYSEISYVAEAGGSLNGTTKQLVKNGEKSQAVTAVPAAGYRFDRWSDGLTTATRNDTATGSDQTFTAIFVASTVEESYTYTFSTFTTGSGVGGEIEGSVKQKLKGEELGKPVTAKAAAGYRFIDWYCDGVTVSTDATIVPKGGDYPDGSRLIARFEKDA